MRSCVIRIMYCYHPIPTRENGTGPCTPLKIVGNKLILYVFIQARLDSTKRVIRAREERISMRRVERQFLSMAVVIMVVMGVVMSVNTVTLYRVKDFVHDAEVYFDCLQVRQLTRKRL